jgi:PAS domain S-box-containing protein
MNEENDFSSLFAPEPTTPRASLGTAPWKVLLVDDEPDIHAVLRLAAQDIIVDGRGLQLLDAHSGGEAKTRLAEHPDIALILLDVVMESEHAGLDLVRYIRNELGNSAIQIVLITGQPGYAPQRQVIAEYKIDGYRLKSELSTEKIFVSVFAALRTHQALSELAAKTSELKTHRDHLENLVAERTAALKESNNQLADTQFAMDRAGIGIHWAAGDSGKFLYVNDYAAKLLGYTVNEMLSMSIPDVDVNLAGKDFGAASKDLAALETATIETTQRHKDGREIPVEVTFYYQTGNNQSAGRFISFITEIAQRKEAELILRKAMETAESANQAKSAFLAKMSHEILTPINGILGMTHLIAQNGLSNKQADQLDKIRRSGLRLFHIVNNLLDLSNIEAKRLALDIHKFSTEEFSSSIIDTLSERFTDKKLSVEILLTHLPPYLYGDDKRLRQILLNYLDNAVKFTESGNITLNARIEEESENDLLIRFEVSDTGIGLSAEQQANLFRSFEQVDNTTARKYSGTGVGLAINKMLAELMGGSVGVSSNANQGCTFWLTVRLARGQSPLADMAGISGVSAEETLKQNYRGTRILLAEDDLTNQAVAIGLLQDTGFDVALAVDGERAVAMSENADYALILMDIQMPGMDGIEATRQIRARSGNSVPIVAMTANAYADDKARCFDAGMNDFIAKPIDPNIVFSTLLKWLPAPKVAAETPAPAPASPATQSNTEQDVMSRLSAVPGLDLERGISVVRGKTARYIQLLSQFIEVHAEDMDRLAENIAAGDHAKAVLLAHSLKGAAATLGIVSLAEAARHIELQQREESDDSKELQADMKIVRHELEVLGAALPTTQPCPPLSGATNKADLQISKRLLNDLDERLANDDFTAIALFQEHGETLRAALGTQCDALAHQIRQFDFQSARTTLRALSAKL